MKNVLAKNTTSLSIAGFLSKILGVAYKLPLIKILGQEGLGVYSITYPIFAIFLVLGTNAFPLGISRLISKYQQEKDIFLESIYFSLTISIIFSLILLIFGKFIASIQGKVEYMLLYYVMSPMVIISFVMGAFRGYFQGNENMKIVAISQVIEQVLKIVFGIILCLMLFRINILYGVLGLFLGIGISELITTIWLIIKYKKQENKKMNKVKFSNIKKIISTVLPISFNSIISTLSQSIVSIIIVSLINYFSVSFATKVFGFSNGIVMSIVNIPLILTSSLSISLLPNITKKLQNKQEFEKDMSVCIKTVLIFSIFFVIMFFVFAGEIGDFLINIFKFDIELDVLINFFRFASVTIFYSAFLQIFNAIMEGFGKYYYSSICLCIGVVVKIIALVLLSKIQSINMYSIFLAESLGIGLSIILEIIFLKKIIDFKLDKKECLIKPIIIFSSIIIIAVVLKSYLEIKLATSILKFIIIVMLVLIEGWILNIFNVRNFIFRKKLQLIIK